MFDTTHGLAHRISPTKLARLDGDVHLYLAVSIVAALVQASEALVMQEGIQIARITRKAFKKMLLKEAGCSYDNYSLVNR